MRNTNADCDNELRLLRDYHNASFRKQQESIIVDNLEIVNTNIQS